MENLECVLCGMPVKPQANGWAGGHNAQPIKEGQCCDECHPLVITKRWAVTQFCRIYAPATGRSK